MSFFNKPIKEEEFIAFDLETTGLHPVADRIIEIGAVRFRGDGTFLDSFQQLIDPRCAISPHATAVNGITNGMVAGKPLIEEVLPYFLDFLGEAQVVMMAHNAGFDMGFLAFAFSRLGWESPQHPVIDTLALAHKRLVLPNYKLETIGRELYLIEHAEHRALEDALLVKDIFLRLMGVNPAIDSTAQLFQEVPANKISQFGAVSDSPPEGFEELWEAMAAGNPVRIKYWGGGTPGSIRMITPLSVVQTGERIYLSAFCHQSKMNKTYRLDLIASYRTLGDGPWEMDS